MTDTPKPHAFRVRPLDMRGENVEVTIAEDGRERHPAFGMVDLHRVQVMGGNFQGASLFDSEVTHHEVMVLSVKPAARKRDLHRDWISEDGPDLIEIRMSMTQWAQLISSPNTPGVPCTISDTETRRRIPSPPFEPRMALQTEETVSAAERALDEIWEAFRAVEAKPTEGNINTLRNRLENAPKNVKFATDQLTKHTEDVVNKARADIEAYVTTKARQLGVRPEDVAPMLALDGDRSAPDLAGEVEA